MKTSQPAASRCRLMAAPMPWAPAVTSARFPRSRFDFINGDGDQEGAVRLYFQPRRPAIASAAPIAAVWSSVTNGCRLICRFILGFMGAQDFSTNKGDPGTLAII